MTGRGAERSRMVVVAAATIVAGTFLTAACSAPPEPGARPTTPTIAMLDGRVQPTTGELPDGGPRPAA